MQGFRERNNRNQAGGAANVVSRKCHIFFQQVDSTNGMGYWLAYFPMTIVKTSGNAGSTPMVGAPPVRVAVQVILMYPEWNARTIVERTDVGR